MQLLLLKDVGVLEMNWSLIELVVIIVLITNVIILFIFIKLRSRLPIIIKLLIFTNILIIKWIFNLKSLLFKIINQFLIRWHILFLNILLIFKFNLLFKWMCLICLETNEKFLDSIYFNLIIHYVMFCINDHLGFNFSATVHFPGRLLHVLIL